METLILPQLRLQQIIKNWLQWIRDDFKINKEEDTYLYRLFGPNSTIGKYNYFTQGKHVFTEEVSEISGLDVRLFFDISRQSAPTIHITLPGENSGADGIGMDEGYSEPIFNDELGEYIPVFTRRYDTLYNIIITSTSTIEALLIYEVLRSGLTSMQQMISVAFGLENMKFSGQDLTINQAMVPKHMFLRMLGVSFSYEVHTPQLIPQQVIRDIVFNQSVIIK